MLSRMVSPDSPGRVGAADSLAKYQLIMETSNDAILFVGVDGAILDANRTAESMYGYTRDELLGLAIRDLRAPDTHSVLHLQMQQALTEGMTFETHHRRRDGTIIAVEVSSRGAALLGSPVLLSVVRDISRRKIRESIQDLLYQTDQLLRGDEPLESGLAQVCEELARTFALPLLWIGLKQPDGSVHVKARGGPYSHLVEPLQVRWDTTIGGSGPTGEALRTGRVQLVSLESALPEQPWWPLVQELGLRDTLSVPMVCRAEVIGAISLYSRRNHAFDDEATGLIGHFAQQLGVMLVEATERDQLRLQTAALNAAANAIVITDAAGCITWTNHAFTKLTGYAVEEAIGQNPRLLKSGLMGDDVFAHLWSTILAGNTWSGELLNKRKDGTIYVDQQTITPVRDSSGSITHFIAIKLDGTERRRQSDHLRYLANHDSLTGLLNRRGFLEELHHFVNEGGGAGVNALLIMDLDRFKVINDTFGHAAGDTALLTAAGVLRKSLRQSDCAARYGGDEFAILLRSVTEQQAVEIAERVRQALQTSEICDGGQCIALSASIGVAMVADSDLNDDILSLADEALAHAKEGGRNQTVVYRPGPRDAAHSRSVWPSLIKSAAAQNRLVLHFQPVVSLGDGRVEWQEALIRMKDLRGELLYPGEFLPRAYRLGLTPELDLWVLHTVLAKVAQSPDLRIAVNLSGQTIQDREVLAAVEQAVATARPRPGSLMFEISETTAVRDLQRINDWIMRMRHLGCRFALDDFGTGVSSFEHVRSLAMDVVKIDGSFVRQLATDRSCLDFIEAIVSLCRSLGMSTVAECVETEEAAELLTGVGVDMGQGYLWGQPAAVP